MKNLFLYGALLSLAATGCNTSLESSASGERPAEATVAQYSIEQFLANEDVNGGYLSPDNSKVLVTSNRSGIYNLYEIPVSGGEWTALSQSDSSNLEAQGYFPNDERVLFAMDNNGDERYHLYVREEDGAVRDLTPYEGARALMYGFSHDGESVYFASNQRDNRYMDLYRMDTDTETYTPELIYENTEGYDINEVSNSGRYIALGKAINTNDSDLYLYDVEKDEMRQVNKARSANSAQDFSVNDDTLFYTTDEGSEYRYLMAYDIATDSTDKIYQAEWDVWSGYFSHDGKYRITVVNEDAASTVEVIETKTSDVVDFPTYENGDITGVRMSRDEGMMTYYVGGSGTPSDLYVFNLATEEATKLTDVLNDEIDREDLVSAEVVRYESFDGTTIPAIYYKPKQASPDQPVPALVWVHGGPGGQSRQNYSGLMQYLVNHGYAVLAVNNRGSSGYGKTFYRMDDQNHGEKDLQDVVEGKNWLAKQPDIMGDRIGIIGGSYGGYMVMAAMAYEPEVFDVGVNLYGVTNWLRTLRSIPPWWESFKTALYEEMGDPDTADSVRLKAISPLYHPDDISKPLMVLQGSQDPRVLKVESDEIVEAVRAKGVPVEYVLFEDEGHGFRKKENQLEAYSKILTFLDAYLAGSERASVE
ncbi:alpha/beta fold hydrolase [Roseivirga sp. BDSF3-8]|uniref:S9 family peptidase n=1 Tax=Roseivirga sp. BDSF3-8 TaxID=3241598 RepID=UPI00353183AF